MTEKIQVSLLKTKGDLSIGCIRLNKPKALNALDLDMVQAMQSQLDAWRVDDSIGAVFIDGEGDRAFCAGGDIVSMYQAMANERDPDSNKLPEFMAQFFEQEYRLDYTIHAFPKPVIAWGNGVIMGGGLGVFAGASHKVVTETARVAMPEITIGLFPDVGASYFLNKMPKGVGKFLGLSASSINAVDCITVGLADYFLLNDDKTAFLKALTGISSLTKASIGSIIEQVHSDVNHDNKDANSNAQGLWATLNGNLSPISAELEALAPLQQVNDITVFLKQLTHNHPNNKMLMKACSSLQNGSPITARLVIEQLKRAEKLSLAECLQMELGMAYQCSITGEFQEGVRALLIDKDNQPKWLFKQDKEIPDDFIEAHFSHHPHQHSESDSALKNPLGSLVAEYGEAHA